ncbi:GNAT family N-acetyltransferase [Variovorax dokdonensis]|uniref:GNAT family N-acetyltransferase n=1 Tax=Variovorax dokdonensis TaxID=344883 RepID=A0ABT7N934_9BURK|nr:GNAT family N-acetyltransferase [Variovorax dokdonensis]MDM0044452.1 GNAT family N-acetyltransferase [Variovorax dokdonensis]
MTVRHLESLFTPASVAVFGASERPGSVGATVWKNLLAGGFKGPVWAVNPKHARLGEREVYANADALPAPPDLALLCSPPRTIAPLVARLGAMGTRAAIIMTPGLTAEQRQAALNAARPHVLRLLGPRSIGLLNPNIGLNATLAHVGAKPGQLAFVSQSGALVTAFLDWARGRGIGVSSLVSLGDRCDVDFGDVLDWLASDWKTRAILLYIESVTAPRKFMSAARAAARNKPVIVVKAGRGGAGLAAVQSRSGDGPVGDDLVYDAAIRRAGMLRVDTLQDLLTAATTLARFRANQSSVITIMTNGGGAGVAAADAADAAGVALATPSARLRQASKDLDAPWLSHNPVDIGGDAPVQRYVDTLGALMADPDAGAVILLHAPSDNVSAADIAQACLPALKTQAIPRVMTCWMGDAAVAPARETFERAGAPCYITPESAVRAFAMLQTYRRNQEALMEVPSVGENASPDTDAARVLIEQANEWLDQAQVATLLGAYGIALAPPGESTDPLALAHRAARSRQIQVVARIDPLFGPVILCGHGGSGEEDMAAGLPPLNRVLAREMVQHTRVARWGEFGDGVRPPVRLEALYDVLIAISQMLAEQPRLAELELSPLWLDDQDARVGTARVRVSRTPVAGAERFAIVPYPTQWSRQLQWQGRTITLRPIRPEDEPQHAAFVERASMEDLRLRFFSARKSLPHSELARMTQIDYDREMAFIAEGLDADGHPETLGVGRTVANPDLVEAEFAVLVRSDLKGMGMGRLLLSELITHARARGYERLYGIVLRENQGMLGLARSLGFVAERHEDDEPDTQRMVLHLKPAP